MALPGRAQDGYLYTHTTQDNGNVPETLTMFLKETPGMKKNSSIELVHKNGEVSSRD